MEKMFQDCMLELKEREIARVSNQTSINALRTFIVDRLLNNGKLEIEAVGKACQRLLETLADVKSLLDVKMYFKFEVCYVNDGIKVKRKPRLTVKIENENFK